MATVIKNTRLTLEMIKIEHTLFALPFAFLGAVLAANGLPSLGRLLWIIVAMVGARSTAMAFNRIADRITTRSIRARHTRALPAGLLSVGFVWAFTIVSAALFFLAAAMLNRLTLMLAPVALASVLLYSFTKRWTLLSHLVLGWCLSIAPTGAWIAVRGALDSPVPLLLSLVVLLVDRGLRRALCLPGLRFRSCAKACIRFQRALASRAHFGSRVFFTRQRLLALLGFILDYAALVPFALAGVVATGALLVYQHRLVRADDLSRLNAAFFTTNAFVSVILFVTFGGAVFLHR